jgi:glycosyltransferase involved in cell wall biosynthesis
LKVLHITNNYPTKNNPDYGVFTKDQIDNLSSEGFENELIFINSKEYGIKEYFLAVKKIRSVYKNFDIIHCFHGLTLIITFLATKDKPILISFLNEIKYENLKKNKFLNQIYILIYNNILKSKRVFAIFKNRIPEKQKKVKRSFYLPNGVNLQDFHSIDKKDAYGFLNLDDQKRYILFVASKNKMRTQKRYDIFKSTMDILKNDYRQYNFEELVMSGVPRKNSIYYYNVACVHLLVSNYEGSPNSVKEAMSCNIPVVSTDVGNVKEIISGATNCFISAQNPSILAKYVVKAIKLQSQDLRNILIKNKLTVKDKTIELIKIYKQILDKCDDIKK